MIPDHESRRLQSNPSLMRSWRLAIAGGVTAVALAACSSDSSDFSTRVTNQPAKQLPVGERWRFEPRCSRGFVVDIRIVQGPAGMRFGRSGDKDVFWTPTLQALGEHPVVLDVTAVEGLGGPEGKARMEFTLRVHQDLELGVVFSPRGHPDLHGQLELEEHFTEREHGRVRSFHGPWREGIDQAGRVPGFVSQAMEAARTFGFVPAIGILWSDADGTPDLASGSSLENSWLNAETRAEFQAMVETLALEWQPPYVFLGNETERYFEASSPAEWEAWMSELEACARAVRAVSPGTRVFTTFQLEALMGLGADEDTKGIPRWELVERLREAGFLDAVGFTTFPHLEYDAVSLVPPSHWSSIREHWDGPVVFTEVAWPHSPRGPFPGDELEQAEFVSVFLDGVSELEVEYAAWAFLHEPDPAPSEPRLAAVGLRDNLGLELRAADALWSLETARRQRP